MLCFAIDGAPNGGLGELMWLAAGRTFMCTAICVRAAAYFSPQPSDWSIVLWMPISCGLDNTQNRIYMIVIGGCVCDASSHI